MIVIRLPQWRIFHLHEIKIVLAIMSTRMKLHWVVPVLLSQEDGVS